MPAFACIQITQAVSREQDTKADLQAESFKTRSWAHRKIIERVQLSPLVIHDLLSWLGRMSFEQHIGCEPGFAKSSDVRPRVGRSVASTSAFTLVELLAVMLMLV